MKCHNVLFFLMFLSCGRPAVWETEMAQKTPSFQLEKQVALLDASASRVLLLSTKSDQTLQRKSVAVGANALSAQTSSNGKQLMVSARGRVATKQISAEAPSLTVIQDSTARRYELESPHSGMSIDPEGKWVALFADAKQTDFVENPNELVLIDLETERIVTRTLRSFGGRPQRISFTPKVSLPGGARRLLVVETEQDVVLLDLDSVQTSPERPEISVPLSSVGNVRPLSFILHEGDVEDTDDTRMAIRLSNSSAVAVLTFVSRGSHSNHNSSLNEFRLDINLLEVGGEAGDLTFVQTEKGLRLVATVPSKNGLTVVDPKTSVALNVPLPASYTHAVLLDPSARQSRLLLYSQAGQPSVALFSMDENPSQTDGNLEVVNVPARVTGVTSVPQRPNQKLLTTTSNVFYVLDAVMRTAAPMTTSARAELRVSSQGERLWAYSRSSSNLSEINLTTLHPVEILMNRKVSSLFEIPNEDTGSSLVVLAEEASGGVIVFDAAQVKSENARHHRGLLLGELP